MEERINAVLEKIQHTLGVPLIYSSSQSTNKILYPPGADMPDEVTTFSHTTVQGHECQLILGRSGMEQYAPAIWRLLDMEDSSSSVSEDAQNMRTLLVGQLANTHANADMDAFIEELGLLDDVYRAAFLFSLDDLTVSAVENWRKTIEKLFLQHPSFDKQDIWGPCGDNQYLVFKRLSSSDWIAQYLDSMDIARSLVKNLQGQGFLSSYIAIGSAYLGFDRLKESFRETVFLHTSCEEFSTPNKHILHIRDHLFDYLCNMVPTEVAHALFEPLDAVAKNHPKMVETIGMMVQKNMNVVASAQGLGLHRNTMMQRLNTIEQTFALNPKYDDRHRMFLKSYMIYRNRKTVLHACIAIQPGSVLHQGLDRMADLIKRRSGGSLVLERHTIATSGDNALYFNMLCQGALDMYIGSTSVMRGATNGMSDCTNLPFTFESSEQAKTILNSIVRPELEKPLSVEGAHLLGIWSMGWRYLTSMTPIEKPEDLAGKRVRVMYDTDILADYLHKMGAETIPIHYGDVARAFEANLVDCEENPYNNILNMKFYRFQKYITDMRYLFSTEGCYVSQ